VLSRINSSTAGVTATYDSANDRVVLTNKNTGDVGITVAETSGGLLDALGLSTAAGGTLAHGQNAEFRVNGGALLSSATNTLEASAHGITGLSVTVNSTSTQTLQIESDSAAMSAAITNFIEKFNTVQDYIDTSTKVTVTGGSVSTSVLSENREIQEWARNLQRMAFDAVTGLTGTVKRLDSLGIDFNSITGKLAVKNSGKLATALSDHPEDVSAFFLQANTGFVAKMYGYMTNVVDASRGQQGTLGKANTDLDEQIATLQSRLESQREMLTNSFIRMLDAQSAAQSQTSYLTNAFFKNNSSN
jgi:flagellar hook-associated protein 2